ncbi:hypothetical protein ACIBJF_50540 [Streptomyces sp. NPDC050743]|uniref:hypothetical protein n=1 Tax=Streptomyces sp. NPDC050743 TaxID=3365634 RepID=UPI0037A0C237
MRLSARATPDTETVTEARIYHTAIARSWSQLHLKLAYRSFVAVTPPDPYLCALFDQQPDEVMATLDGWRLARAGRP